MTVTGSRSQQSETAAHDLPPIPAGAWDSAFARRSERDGGGITAILALAAARDIITFSGGFPAPETFPVDRLAALTQRLMETDPGVALQYSPSEGLPGLRDLVGERLGEYDGHRPAEAELMITSGGIDALTLLAHSLLDAGDLAIVEGPSYLGAIMGFRGFEADVRAVPLDNDGLDVDALADLLAAGTRPKLLYTIPDYQNPTGVSMSAARRHALVALCRRYGVLVIEDVAYRDIGFTAERLPSLFSLAPDLVVQIGTFSKTFFPGVRLGWAAGPATVIARMVTAKQNSDQCAGAFGQRLAEEYVRSGDFDRQLTRSRSLYAHRAERMAAALAEHMPDGVTWTRPTGGFFTWVTAPDHVDMTQLMPAAARAKVAYVPGAPFHPDGSGHNTMRLSYSRVSDDEITEGVRRLAGLLSPPKGQR